MNIPMVKTKHPFQLLSLLLVTLLVIQALLFPTHASADALYDWNTSCTSKTGKTVELLDISDFWNPVVTGSLPANTYVQKIKNMNPYMLIQYRAADGRSGEGYIYDGNTISTTVYFIYDKYGTCDLMHELIYSPSKVPSKTVYISYYGNLSLDFGSYDTASNGAGSTDWWHAHGSGSSSGSSSGTGTSSNTGSSSNTKSSSSSSSSPPSSSSSSSSASAQRKPPESVAVTDGEGEPVTVQYLGTAYTAILKGQEPMIVRTDSLAFGETEAEPLFAVIHAPRTGKASLRRTASNHACALKQCKAGVIAYVMEQGKTFSLVDYQGSVGYVKNASLTFYPPSDDDAPTGRLHYNGHTNGSTTINVRLTEDGRMIGDFRTGTAVAVFQQGDSWSEIEVDGYHGFVMNKFLLIDD